MYSSTQTILEEALTTNLSEIYKAQPELFNLEKLGADKKARLIHDNQKVFLEPIASLRLSPYEKFVILRNTKGAAVGKRIKLSEDELKKLQIGSYMELIKMRFDEYIRVDIYNGMSKARQSELFLFRPGWVIEQTGIAPALTLSVLESIAHGSPDVIDKHYSDFHTKLRTSAWFWENMIKFDSDKYFRIFLDNMRTLKNKTEVRSVFRQHPKLIKLLTLDILEASPLSGKEWTILIDEIIRSEKRLFAKFTFSNEFTEYFELDLTTSILKGKGSKKLQNATKNIVAKGESQRNTEDTSPQTSA